MSKFKKGDKVICIDVSKSVVTPFITIGKTYDVLDAYNLWSTSFIDIVNDKGQTEGLQEKRFELAPTLAPKVTIDTIGNRILIDPDYIDEIYKYYFSVPDNKCVTLPKSAVCNHEWKTYDSGWSKYEYCETCDQKKT